MAGVRLTRGELSEMTHSRLSAVRPPRCVTADSDDQPLNLSDRLQSSPADPVQMPRSQLPQAGRVHDARCV